MDPELTDALVQLFASGVLIGLAVGIAIGHWMRGLEHGWRTLLGTSYISSLKREDETYAEWQERLKG